MECTRYTAQKITIQKVKIALQAKGTKGRGVAVSFENKSNREEAQRPLCSIFLCNLQVVWDDQVCFCRVIISLLHQQKHTAVRVFFISNANSLNTRITYTYICILYAILLGEMCALKSWSNLNIQPSSKLNKTI